MKSKRTNPAALLPTVEKMLYSFAWKITQAYPVSFEDAKAEVYFLFMRACRLYKPGKGKFSTHCYFVIAMQLRTFITQRSSRLTSTLPRKRVAKSCMPPTKQTTRLAATLRKMDGLARS